MTARRNLTLLKQGEGGREKIWREEEGFGRREREGETTLERKVEPKNGES